MVVDSLTDRTVDATATAGTDERDAALDPSPGHRLGRYEITDRIGSGGAGIVFAARDPRLDRRVAIKLLTSSRSGAPARLRQEARALARLNHPNIVTIHDVGEDGDRCFIAMELVDGSTLDRWLAERPRSWREIVAMFCAAGRGLAAAHAEGVVHLDFKPSNVMVDVHGRARVLDFGLARVAETSATADGFRDALPEVGGRVHSPVGTPAYMAPEQFAGKDATAQSDQFSFCVVLWEALFGKRPFVGELPAEIAVAVTEGRRRVPPPNVHVPQRIRRALDRGLRLDPTDRWPSLRDLLARLEPRRRPLWWPAGAALALGAVAVFLVDEPAQERCATADEHLAGIWDDARRERARASFEATRLGYAADTWDRAEPELDRWVERWRTAYTANCAAVLESTGSEQELMVGRAACLRGQLQALASATALFTAADESSVTEAVDIVGALPTPDACDDPQPSPGAADPRRAAQMAELRRELAAIGVLQVASAPPIGLLERAEDLGDPSLIAQALCELGEDDVEKGDEEQAQRRFERAYFLALRAGDDPMAARAARHRSGAAYRRADYLVGLEWIGHARARLPDGASEEAARVAMHAAELRLGTNETTLALEEARRAVELAVEAEARPQLESATRQVLAQALRAEGRPDEGFEQSQRAVSMLVDALGPLHPRVAIARNNLGAALFEAGRYEEALVEFTAVRDMERSAPTPSHENRGIEAANVGQTLYVLDRYEEAIPLQREAVAVFREARGLNHPDYALALSNLAASLSAVGEHEEAIARAVEALAISEEALGRDHPRFTPVVVGLSAIRIARGEAGEAVRELRSTLITLEGQPNRRRERGALRTQLAKALGMLGRCGDALAEVERVRADLEAIRGISYDEQLQAVERECAERQASAGQLARSESRRSRRSRTP